MADTNPHGAEASSGSAGRPHVASPGPPPRPTLECRAMRRISDILRTPFGFLVSHSQKEELVAEYMIREHHRGRALDEILHDAYVTNRLTAPQLSRVLERPDVIHAVGEDTIRAHRGGVA